MNTNPRGALVVYLAGAHLTEAQVLSVMAEFCTRTRAIVDENGAIVVLPFADPRTAHETLRSASQQNDGLRTSLHFLHLPPQAVVVETQMKAMRTSRPRGARPALLPGATADLAHGPFRTFSRCGRVHDDAAAQAQPQGALSQAGGRHAGGAQPL